MDLFKQKKSIDLLYDFFVRGKSDVSRIPYMPSKTRCYEGAGVPNYFPRMRPEEKGVPSSVLTDLLHDLEHNARVNMHALTVVCDGAVICEATAKPYRRDIPHVTHSMCKSLTGLAVGLLFDEGLLDLDRPVWRYFAPSQLPGRLSGRMKSVTARHLLTMTSGVSFNEMGVVTELDWVRAFFSADVKYEPGSKFTYNSLNTYILSALVRRLSGVGLVEYLRPRLLEPLGIREIFWECCPLGIEKGGWGLYIAQEDMAKIGYMCLCGGLFEGRRILSEDWVAQATALQVETPPDTGDYNYAYQIWTARNGASYLFNGMLGQNTWICPGNRLVVVANAGNSEFFQAGAMLDFFEKHLGRSLHRSETPLRPSRRAYRRLLKTQAAFFDTRAWTRPLPEPGLLARIGRTFCGTPIRPLPALYRPLDDRVFRFRENNTGLLPLFTRLMQNNHTAGLREVRFFTVGNRFFCSFDEGEGELYTLELGFYGFVGTTLCIRGERYLVAAQAAFAVDEDGRRLLKIDVVFPELTHTRRIKVFFEEEVPFLQLREVPGREVLDGLLRSLPATNPKARGIVGFIRNRLNLDYLLIKIYEKFEPRMAADASRPVALPGAEALALLAAAEETDDATGDPPEAPDGAEDAEA